ncbi:MAG: diguanylate cyclase, partial [Planctomycetaceae bacterium]
VDYDLLEIISQSRSHFNGATDGDRRVGFEIHQGARILSVADAYDSLATDQVYRDAKPHDEIMSILVSAAGTQFDGNVIGALQRWIETNEERLTQLRTGRTGPPVIPDDSNAVCSLPAVFTHLYQLESLYDGFCVLDADKKFVVWSCGAEALLGVKARDLLQQTWSSYRLLFADQSGEQELHGDDSPLQQVLNTGKATTNTVQIQRQDGKWIKVELQSVPLIDQHGQIQGAVEIFQDQSCVGRGPYAYRELKLKASSDALTSLANRGELETQLMLMVSEYHKRANHSEFSVLFLDIDYFKSINDIYGHTVGDRVLVEVARLLENETYSGELIGRYGGEEFVVLCPDTDLNHAVQRAERLRGAIGRYLIDGIELDVTASFGVAEIETGDSAESIIRRADAAMYQAKRLGRNRVSSLSSGSEDDQSTEEDNSSQVEFCLRDSFYACVAKELIVHKLGGFIDELQAKLVEVAPTRAVLRVGVKGLLPFWGTNSDRQPVELEMEFAPVPRMPRAVSSRVCVTVWIRPLGWIRDPLVFQLRAKSVYKIFKEYFAAE